MKILVYPHQLLMGGSQINAIELAATIRDQGHEVTVTAPQGVLCAMIQDLRLDYVPTPVTSYFPSARTATHLLRLSRRLKSDVIHAYEWRPAVEATFGPHLFRHTPIVITVLSVTVPNFLPRHVPLVVGTEELARHMEPGRRVYLLEPPIDTAMNRSTGGSARTRWRFREDEIVVSVVCRLTPELEKLQGVLEAMDAIEALAERWPLRYLIAGGGIGLEDVRRKAAQVNGRLGREVILATGELLDPRDAYDAADILLGMGSSALKAMAFSKPLVVQGTQGFWRLLDKNSASLFFDQGWFGHGGGGSADLAPILDRLAGDPLLRGELGVLGRSIVEKRFGLEQAADRLLDIYRDALAAPLPIMSSLPSLCRSAAQVAKFRAVMGLRALSAKAAR